MKIALFGGPGCGKTSLARQLTSRLYNDMHVNTEHVSEFAREHINRSNMHGGFDCSMADQMMIFDSQYEKEKNVPKEVEVLITDCPMFINLYYACGFVDHFNQDVQSIDQYANLYKKWLCYCTDAYDHIFFVKRDGYAEDGTRYQTEQEAIEIDEALKGFLKFHRIYFAELSGSYKEMTDEILDRIKIKDKKINKDKR